MADDAPEYVRRFIAEKEEKAQAAAEAEAGRKARESAQAAARQRMADARRR